MQQLTRQNDERVDELEASMFNAANDENSDVQFIDCPLNHYFLPDLYIREIMMPADAVITSEVHKTRHPFVVLQGVLSVIIDGKKELIEAPYAGVTEAGTRRVLQIHTNTVWRTFHTLDFIIGNENWLPYEETKKIVDKISDLILEPYENKLLGGRVFLNQITNNKIEEKCHGLQ